jgi:hypothetical protein
MRVLLAGIAIEGGGAEQVIADLAEGLSRSGHSILVALTAAFGVKAPGTAPGLQCPSMSCQPLLGGLARVLRALG